MYMKAKPKTKAGLESLANIGRGGQIPWPTLGHMLDQAATTQYWATEGARSFTEWLQQFSKRSGMGVAMLWRILSAIRFYRIIQKNYPEMDLIPLDAASPRMTPDHLEMLSKLSRVMSHAEFKAQLRQVLDGAVTRTQLRDTWRAFRPVLVGRNARGRGQIAPMANPRDPEQFNSLVEARIYQAIAATGSAWTGIQKPILYRLLLQTGSAPIPESSERYIFDAIAVMQNKSQSTIQIHGLEFMSVSRFVGRKIEILKAWLPYCDYVWVATSESMPKEELDKLPMQIGILVACDNQVEILRSAQRIDGNTAKHEAMLRALLAQTLRG